MAKGLVVSSEVEAIQNYALPKLLDNIRPEWQSKRLIERVYRLVEVDPSSACQRLFNAAIHDLREKVRIAGIDIAKEAAAQNKLPPVDKDEDVESYSTHKLIDLCFRMGLLSRAEWRRLHRCYEIRRDLEHEDDQYEAGIEDFAYIAKTCIDVVLARDPIQVVRVSDIKEVIEASEVIALGGELLTDLESAPEPRQEEIAKFLVSMALDGGQPDLVQQNAFHALPLVGARIRQNVRVNVGRHIATIAGRKGLTERIARVANALGVMPYLRKSAISDLYGEMLNEFDSISPNWSAYARHGDLLNKFREIGGFKVCPDDLKDGFLKWMVYAFIGTKGGQTSWGNIRHVYYSDTASPLIKAIFEEERAYIENNVGPVLKDAEKKRAGDDKHLARRVEILRDVMQGSG